jgi:hypothetical protein
MEGPIVHELRRADLELIVAEYRLANFEHKMLLREREQRADERWSHAPPDDPRVGNALFG